MWSQTRTDTHTDTDTQTHRHRHGHRYTDAQTHRRTDTDTDAQTQYPVALATLCVLLPINWSIAAKKLCDFGPFLKKKAFLAAFGLCFCHQCQITHRQRWGRRVGWIAACIELYLDRESERTQTQAAAPAIGGGAGATHVAGHGGGDVAGPGDGALSGPRKSRRLAASASSDK